MLLIFVSVVCQGWIKKLLVYSQLLICSLDTLESFFRPGGASGKSVTQETVNAIPFSGGKIGWLLDVNYGTVTGQGCVCVFKFFFILLFCCYKEFSEIYILNFSCTLLFLVSKCDIFNKQEIFHYVNEILKENSLYLCLTNI